jgi:hypothetical protein
MASPREEQVGQGAASEVHGAKAPSGVHTPTGHHSADAGITWHKAKGKYAKAVIELKGQARRVPAITRA